MSELNLKNAEVELIVKSLNKNKYKYEAAKELGLCARQLTLKTYRYRIKIINGKWVKL